MSENKYIDNKEHQQTTDQQKNPNLDTEKNNHHQHQHYDPDTIPPNFEIADHHYRSVVVGKAIPQSNGKFKICECCSRKYDRQQEKLNCNLSEIAYLGSGFPLYFEFLKYVIFILSIVLLVSGVYNVVSSVGYGETCKDIEHIEGLSEQDKQDLCQKNWVTIISLGNKVDQDELMTFQSILNLAATLIVIVALQFFRRNQRITETECDIQDVAANDYTVMIKRIPVDFEALNNDYDDDLKDFLEKNLFPNKKAHIKEINLCYKLQEYYKILKDKNNHIADKQKLLQKMHSKQSKLQKDSEEYKKILEEFQPKIQDYDKEIHEEDQKIEDLHKKFEEGKGREFMKRYFSGFAFVSFNTEAEKDECLDMYLGTLYKSKKKINYHGSDLVILEAAKAKDVFWQNFHMRRRDIAKRTIIGSILTLILLVVCFWLIFGITEGQMEISESSSSTSEAKDNAIIVQLMAVGLGVVITIINSVLSILIVKITEYESHRTRTEHNIFLAKKLAVAQFINSSIINFLIQTVFSTQDRSQVGIVFGQGGLAQNQNFIFISQCFIPVLTEIINIPWLIQKIKQKQQLKLKDKSVLTQEQLQGVFQNIPFVIEEKYAALLNLIYTTVFYAPILPQALLYTIVGIFALYWIHKYNFLYRTTVSFACGSELSLEIIEMMEYILPIFSASNLFFFIYINGNDGVNGWTISPLVIGLIHAFLPMQKLNKKLFKLKESPPNEQEYDEAKMDYFTTDYARENPATQEQARKVFLHQQLKHDHEKEHKQKEDVEQKTQDQQQEQQHNNNVIQKDQDNQQVISDQNKKESSISNISDIQIEHEGIQNIEFGKYQPFMNRQQIQS